MKKLLSATLALAMILTGICLFTSCEPATAAAVVEKADKALTSAPYTMTISMDFASDNGDLSAVLDTIGTDIPVTVDGENVSFSMSIGSGADTTNLQMVVVDKVLYYDIQLLGQSVKMKATMSDEDYAELRSESGISMPVNPSHFEKLTMETQDGKQIITCTGISEEGRTLLNESLGETIDDIGFEMALTDLSFVLTVSDGKYESMALSVTYTAALANETVTVTANLTAKFSYADIAPITAPADADKYTEIDPDDLLE